MTIKEILKDVIKNLQKRFKSSFFSLRKLFSNFQHLPVNFSYKLFDTLIRPVVNYNSEIWYMDDYLPLYRALLRAEKMTNFVMPCLLIIEQHIKNRCKISQNNHGSLKNCL